MVNRMIKPVITLAVAGGALALAGCATHPTQVNNRGAQPKVTKNQKSNRVCFSTTPIGSHLPKIHCMSKAAYKAHQKAQEQQSQKDRDAIRRAQSHSGGL
jgi:PBP1b-binding outer membrane lipoprotein LpoB